MNIEKKSQRIFIGFAFIWSFILWGLGIFLSVKGNVKLLESTDLLSAVLNNTLSRELWLITVVNTLAGYGPLLAAIVLVILFPDTRKYFKHKFKLVTPLKYVLQIIALFLLISIIPAIPLVISKGFNVPLTWSLVGFVLLFFVYQIITAGTEEIGWRGYLLPSMLKNRTPWKASVSIGVIWALWHTPIILYVFYTQGMTVPQIIMSFAGFIVGTIAMSTVHTYYYLKTDNLLFNVFIHAVANTLPMFIGMLSASSYEISVAVQLLLWVFVIVITRKNKALFDTVREQ
ncbi:MAG: CPBP family intramembrane metalloprotease [Clostridiaceae bacterium]|nr:CPBP family intramembrane metalloprotease [Clostridiaceae bacterium]